MVMSYFDYYDASDIDIYDFGEMPASREAAGPQAFEGHVVKNKRR